MVDVSQCHHAALVEKAEGKPKGSAKRVEILGSERPIYEKESASGIHRTQSGRWSIALEWFSILEHAIEEEEEGQPVEADLTAIAAMSSDIIRKGKERDEYDDYDSSDEEDEEDDESEVEDWKDEDEDEKQCDDVKY